MKYRMWAVIGLYSLAAILSGCTTGIRPSGITPVAAGCDASCATPCDKGRTWDVDGETADDWDALAELTLDYADKLRACEVRRQSCAKCLDRLREAGVIQ